MGFLDWFKREKRLTDYTPEDLRREEGRLQIRENQAIARIEKMEALREQTFRQGLEMKSAIRRRILARKYEQREQEIRQVERELGLIMREAMTVSAIRYRLERRAKGENSVLRKVGSEDVARLEELFENDAITEEMYQEKLTELLGVVEDQEGDPGSPLGDRGRSVLAIWERMDVGEISSVEEGLREARELSGEEPEAETE